MYRPYRPTKHAEERRLEMGLGTKEIKRALNHPETSYPGDPARPGRTVYLHGRVAVVVDDRTDKVVTILWRGAEGRDESGRACLRIA